MSKTIYIFIVCLVFLIIPSAALLCIMLEISAELYGFLMEVVIGGLAVSSVLYFVTPAKGKPKALDDFL